MLTQLFLIFPLKHQLQQIFPPKSKILFGFFIIIILTWKARMGEKNRILPGLKCCLWENITGMFAVLSINKNYFLQDF